MENPVIRRPRTLQTAGEKISIRRAIAKHPRTPEPPDPLYSQRTQFSTAWKSPCLNNPKSLNNDFHNSQNWFRLGSFPPNFAPFPSCLTPAPQPSRKCFFAKRTQRHFKNRAPRHVANARARFLQNKPSPHAKLPNEPENPPSHPTPMHIEVSS
jgi:hypothetical protein